MRQWFICLAVALVGTATAAPRPIPVPPSQRDRSVPSPITDRFHVRGTYFSASADTEVRLDPSATTPGTLLDAEEDLGLADTDEQARIELMFRLRERNRIRMDFFKLDRSGAAVLNRQVVFGDEVFDVNDRVLTTLDIRMLTFTYSRSLVRRENVELGAGLGIHLLETEARGAVPAQFQREEEAQAGALPTVALDFTWRLTPRFALTARGQYFTASVDEFDGELSDYHVDLQYRFRPNVAIGLGWSAITLELDVEDTSAPGRFVMDTTGPELFFRVSY